MIEKFAQYITNHDDEFVIFDVGSRDCQQSIEFYKTFPNAKIYAFECNPNTLEICENNILPYNDRITLIKGAVCDYDGEITFYPINQKETVTTWEDGNPGASSIFKSNGKYPHEKYVQDEIKTNCHRLDSVMKKYNIANVDIIWMDLQGAELLALKGLGKNLMNVKYIHTEISHKEMYTGQVMFKELHNYILSYNFSALNNITMNGWQEDVIYKNNITQKSSDIDLTLFKYDKYSQRGHDGIIEKIMEILKIENGFFIEFGAWDGIHLSNSRYLFDNGWKGCFIEADQNKFVELVDNYKNTEIITLNKFVYPTASEGDTIDILHEKYMDNIDVDLLSIDIDGRDYEIFENLKLKPKLIIIEGGFTFHPCLKEKIPYDIARNNIQQPLHVMFELAYKKGYVPICFNQDTFLLRKDLYDKFDFFKNIKNDAVSLWNSAYNNIFSETDRNWLKTYRMHNSIVRNFEPRYYLDIEHSINNCFDIVLTNISEKEIQKQLEYVKKNVIGYRNIYLITSNKSIMLDGCIVINEEVFPFNRDTVSVYSKDFDLQVKKVEQLQKMYAGNIIPGILDKYFVFDSNVFFVKPISFVENNKCLYSVKKNNKSFDLGHYMIIEKKYMDEIINKIENYEKDKFYNVFLKQIDSYNKYGETEYDIYLKFIIKNYMSRIIIRKLNWKQISNFQEVTSDIDYVINDLIK